MNHHHHHHRARLSRAALAVLWCATAWVCLGLAPHAARAGDAADGARAQLREILRDPAFHRWERRYIPSETGSARLLSVPRSWRDAVRDAGRWLRDLLKRWLRSRPGHQPPSAWSGPSLNSVVKVIGWTAAILLALCIVILIIKLTMARPRRVDERAVTRQRLREAMDSGEALAADSPQWLDEAQRLADEADLRRAYRAMYLALLSGLHRARAIDFKPNRTNWTYVRLFRGPEHQRDRLARLTDRFDDVWYGNHAPTPQSMDPVRREVAALLSGGEA